MAEDKFSTADKSVPGQFTDMTIEIFMRVDQSVCIEKLKELEERPGGGGGQIEGKNKARAREQKKG